MKKILSFIIILMGFNMLFCCIASAENDFSSSSQFEEKVDELIKILKYGQDISAYEPSKQDAVIALGLLKDPRSVDVLIEYLKNTNVDSLRQQIITSLGWIGDKRAVPVLIDVLDNDHYVHARCMAALALGDMGEGEEVIIALEKAYREDKDLHVRTFAGMSLEKITGKTYDIEASKIIDEYKK